MLAGLLQWGVCGEQLCDPQVVQSWQGPSVSAGCFGINPQGSEPSWTTVVR